MLLYSIILLIQNNILYTVFKTKLCDQQHVGLFFGIKESLAALEQLSEQESFMTQATIKYGWLLWPSKLETGKNNQPVRTRGTNKNKINGDLIFTVVNIRNKWKGKGNKTQQ